MEDVERKIDEAWAKIEKHKFNLREVDRIMKNIDELMIIYEECIKNAGYRNFEQRAKERYKARLWKEKMKKDNSRQ
ncbi:MAG: hypothetical protein R3B39_01130 [Candidatus Paceibacterota bacterium]